MTTPRGNGPVGLSLLDRLIDEDLKTPGRQLTRSESLRKLRNAVRRDLEWLLNTRQPVEVAAEGSQLEKSLYMYGLPDINSLSTKNARDRQLLVNAIELAIETFEPRIANPRVVLLERSDDLVPVLRFLIEGMLRVEPNPEPVSFDTLLELSNGEYKVRGDAGAR